MTNRIKLMQKVLSVEEFEEEQEVKELSNIPVQPITPADEDFLNHLEVPLVTEDTLKDKVALEGIIRGIGGSIVDDYARAAADLKGYFLGIESKRQYIEELCNQLITWLKDKKFDNRNLDLDVNLIKNLFKTHPLQWRYYLLLDDTTWQHLESDIKANNLTDIENLTTHFTFLKGKNATRLLKNVKTIDELIKLVELYKTRSNKFFALILQRKLKVKGTPFHLLLLGVIDLRTTAKKIVNLAI